MAKINRKWPVFLIFFLIVFFIHGDKIAKHKDDNNKYLEETVKAKSATGFELLTPVNVSKSPENSSRWPDIEFGPDGLPHIVWEEDYPNNTGSDIMHATYDGTTWTVQKITNTPSVKKEHANIGVGRDGTICIAWDQRIQIGLTTNAIICKIYSPKTQAWSDPIEVATGGRGGDIPMVAVDSKGNIFMCWFQERGGRTYSRARINNQWESTLYTSQGFGRSTFTDLCVSKQDVAWMIFRVRKSYGPNIEYKTFYSKRTAGSKWTRGKIINERGDSNSHPSICTAPDGTPYVYWQNLPANTNLASINEVILDEKTNPLVQVFPSVLLHYPMGGIDIYGNRHLAFQIGPGDNGRGIMYMYKQVDKDWSDAVLLPYSEGGPKLSNLEVDDFGNIGIVWPSYGYPGESDIFFTSLYPIEPKGLKPPLNLTFSLEISSIEGAFQAMYTLGWQANPLNNDSTVKNYLIYQKINDGEYQLFEEVDKDIFTRIIKITDPGHKYKFALSVISNSNYESEKVEFLPSDNQ